MPHKIVSITEGTVLLPDGNFKRTRIVRYTVGTAGPFQLEIDASEFSTAEVTRRIEADVREVEGLTGGS